MTKPNVLFIVLDAVRASNLSTYGHNRPTTPSIDALAEESIVFDRAVSPTGVTLDSVTSMLSGMYPGEHQSGRLGQMNAHRPLLPLALSNAGYTTGMVTCNPFIAPAFGFEADVFHPVTHAFSKGMSLREFFSRTKELPTARRYLRFLRESLNRNFPWHIANALQFKFGLFEGNDDGAAKATHQAIKFIQDASSSWFLYIHLTETHMNSADKLPYAIPKEDQFRFINNPNRLPDLQTHGGEVDYDDGTADVHERLYDAALRYLDDRVADLFDTVRHEDDWDDTLVILTADHGELLGEHGLLGHGYLYEPGIHVPLIVKPARNKHSKHINHRVNTLWLYRTILSAVDIVPENAPGVDLLAEEAPDTVLVQDYSDTWDWSRYEGGGEGRHAIYRDEMKLLTGQGRRELYDVSTASEEATNLNKREPDIVSDLEAALEEILNQIQNVDEETTEMDFSADTRDRLRDLGYLE